MNTEPISIDQFFLSELRRLNLFVAFWKTQAAQNLVMQDGDPIWPLELPPGDWDAQLLGFDEADIPPGALEPIKLRRSHIDREVEALPAETRRQMILESMVYDKQGFMGDTELRRQANRIHRLMHPAENDDADVFTIDRVIAACHKANSALLLEIDPPAPKDITLEP